jgi:hypothetical protein
VTWFRRIIIGAIALACVWLAFVAVVPKLIGQDFYRRRLDSWVSGGGSASEIQSGVGENCGKLVFASAGVFENIRYITFGREDFDFRVDVCMKMTVNRVYKQPEFENEKIVSTICDGGIEFFRQLCRQSGLRSN